MNHGVLPVKRRKTNYSTRSLGATAVDYSPFSLDAEFGFPDQNADGAPEDCTIYTQNELCEDEDKQKYNRAFLKGKVIIESGQPNGPYQIYDSLKCICVYGVQADGETDDQAETHKRGAYFQLEKQNGMDWFDSALSVMRTNQRPLSVAGPWFPVFEVPLFGLIPEIFPSTWTNEPGHNHIVYGLTQVNNKLVLVGKSWQGPNFGNHGEHYWTRTAFNRYMDIFGAAAFTVSKFDGQVQTIQWGIIYRLQLLISYYVRLLTNR